MQIDLDKINKLPPDVRDRFQKLLIKYKEEDKKEQEPVVEIKASDIEGLDDISIHAPWSSTIGDWNDSAINYKKWR